MRAAAEFSADLLVLGSHGLTVDSHSIGNIASKCVRKAPLPVLLVRDTHHGAFRKVVAGVDFSDTSFTALREAALIAEPSPDTEPRGTEAPLFVFDPDAGEVQYRMVRIGDLRGNEIEVFEGLEAGDQVVSAGVAFVRDGMTATVWTPRR